MGALSKRFNSGTNSSISCNCQIAAGKKSSMTSCAHCTRNKKTSCCVASVDELDLLACDPKIRASLLDQSSWRKAGVVAEARRALNLFMLEGIPPPVQSSAAVD
eukprot:3879935-Amphidinium_carterae.1